MQIHIALSVSRKTCKKWPLKYLRFCAVYLILVCNSLRTWKLFPHKDKLRLDLVCIAIRGPVAS